MDARRVAVIGAGAAGLAAARRIVQHPALECRVFEQAADVGGTWRIAEHVGTEPSGLPVHSSMYKNLRTNLPKEIMSYPDVPFPAGPDPYVSAEAVLKYLEDFADTFLLRPHISFRHHVRCVRPLAGTQGGWELEVVDLDTGVKDTQHFDAVMVCNGHYSLPDVPAVAGSSQFRGRVLHSHDYREPQPFAGQRVLVVGAGHSGVDIADDLATCAKQVVLSHHLSRPIEGHFPANVRQAPDLASLTPEGALFGDGTSAQLDAVVFCTGYRYSFPFLHAACGVSTDRYGVQPLYKHLVHLERPSMCFLVVPNYVVPFQLADLQARYFLRVLDGTLQLPSTAEMRAATAQDQKERLAQGLGSRRAHHMGHLQPAYYESLAREAGVENIAPRVYEVYEKSVCAVACTVGPPVPCPVVNCCPENTPGTPPDTK